MFNNQRYSDSVAHNFMQKVYGWMCAGLAITAAIAYFTSYDVNPGIFISLMSNMWLVFGLFIAQFGIIMYMASSFASMSYGSMSILFMLFCALQGLCLSPILYIYTASSVFYVFLIASGMFATMALYGWLTKDDLSSMRNILLMGMIGLIIAQLLNMFIKSANFNIAIAAIGVGIFALLTAYDVQNLKRFQNSIATPEDSGKLALLGAINLYMNLINIFLYLLRLFGDERRK